MGKTNDRKKKIRRDRLSISLSRPDYADRRVYRSPTPRSSASTVADRSSTTTTSAPSSATATSTTATSTTATSTTATSSPFTPILGKRSFCGPTSTADRKIPLTATDPGAQLVPPSPGIRGIFCDLRVSKETPSPSNSFCSELPSRGNLAQAKSISEPCHEQAISDSCTETDEVTSVVTAATAPAIRSLYPLASARRVRIAAAAAGAAASEIMRRASTPPTPSDGEPAPPTSSEDSAPPPSPVAAPTPSPVAAPTPSPRIVVQVPAVIRVCELRRRRGQGKACFCCKNYFSNK